MQEYFNQIKAGIEEAYRVAKNARSLGLDPDTEVEALPAGDLAARVEGLVGPPGIALKIREIGRDNISQIIDSMLDLSKPLSKEEKEAQIDQALRTALAILTEGVVAAPIEGIAEIRIRKNPDGSEYLSVYFSGPIRSAGGTAQGLAVLIGDYLRRKFGLQEYRPTDDEVERYVEEIKFYHERAARLQYRPSDDDIRVMVKNLPVCVDGDPTEEMEVPLHRNLERVETNRIRGGMCLVLAEGVAQKSRKIMQIASSKFNIDWDWLSSVGKAAEKKREEEALEGVKPITKFMEEIVGGRPVFSAPSAKGGFRLRYGRSRASGIAGKSIHPATMVILDGFIATGTQVKVERPGKGCVITECDEVEGPVVKLKDGSVVRVESTEQARQVNGDVVEILFLGDILVSYGDFVQANTPLLPAGYCEEWWVQEYENATGEKIEKKQIPSPEEAVNISLKHNIPLHPRYTYHWEDLTLKEIRLLADWLISGEIVENNLVLDKNNICGKRILELLGAPHQVKENSVHIEEYLPLLYSLSLYENGTVKKELTGLKDDEDLNGFDYVSKVSQLKLRRKVGVYIGCRMGRPEKAKERKMQPAVHSLFPIGEYGGRERSINAAAQTEKGVINVETSVYHCQNCHMSIITPTCPKCGGKAVLERFCSCGWTGGSDVCPRCGKNTRYYKKHDIDIKSLWQKAVKIGRVTDVKGVKGMISEYKIPEILEKGILRANNSVYVFKDGTVRFDATDVPLTHFKPKEINVSVERLRKLGYTKDYLGNELENEDQTIELKIQDVVIPDGGAKYLLNTSRFIDELLTRVYGMQPYYRAEKTEDMIGKLIVGLAPHTSAGITGRIIGFTQAHVCFAHPYWHAAKRRNADGDEDAFMLLMDVLLNFSRKYLPEKRGGKMDAPLVITTILDPKEIDDEAHKMEIVSRYPIEFYEKTLQHVNPSEVSGIVKTVSNILKSDPYSGLNFTHSTGNITGPVIESKYVTLETMEEKVQAQLAVAEKIRAVDEREVAELVINSHFLRDIYGNLHAFTKQSFRCVKCDAKYRRIPLTGKCIKCGGKLLLTVNEGGVRKYLETTVNLIEKYHLSNYLRQRLTLVRMDMDSVFTNDLAKQMSLSEFM